MMFFYPRRLFLYLIAKCADPDEMTPEEEFNLGIHSLPKYLFTGIQNENG